MVVIKDMIIFLAGLEIVKLITVLAKLYMVL